MENLANQNDRISGIISDAEAGSDSFRNFATRIEGEGERISKITADTAAFAETLNSAAGRVDALFDGLDEMMSSDGTTTLMAELQTTLASFRRAAATFELRFGEISDGVTRFSGSGLRNFDGLIADGRRAMNSFNSLLQQLESNPRQFISGGGGVPEYNGRPRR